MGGPRPAGLALPGLLRPRRLRPGHALPLLLRRRRPLLPLSRLLLNHGGGGVPRLQGERERNPATCSYLEESAEFIVPLRRLACGFTLTVQISFNFLFVPSGKLQIPFYFMSPFKEKPLSPSSHDTCGQMKRQCTVRMLRRTPREGNLLIESKIVSCVDNARRAVVSTIDMADRPLERVEFAPPPPPPPLLAQPTLSSCRAIIGQ